MAGVRVSEVNLLKRMISDGLVGKEQAQELLVDVVYRRKKGESASLPQALLNAGFATVEQLVDYGAAQPGTVRRPVPATADEPSPIHSTPGHSTPGPSTAGHSTAGHSGPPPTSPTPASSTPTSSTPSATPLPAADVAEPAIAPVADASASSSVAEAVPAEPAPVKPESTPPASEPALRVDAKSGVPTAESPSIDATPIEATSIETTSIEATGPDVEKETIEAAESPRAADTNRPEDAAERDAARKSVADTPAAAPEPAPPLSQPVPPIADDPIDDNSPLSESAPIEEPIPDVQQPTIEEVPEDPRPQWNRRQEDPGEKRYPPVRPDDGFPAREFLVYYQQARPTSFKTDRRRPVLWILLFLVVGVGGAAGVWWYLQQPTQPTYSDDQPILECFEAFTAALAERKGADAALWLDRRSASYFHDMRYEALMRTRDELKTQSVPNLQTILAIRQAFPERAQVEGLTGRQIFGEFVNRGWFKLPTLAPVEATDVKIKGRQATATFTADGAAVAIDWIFERDRDGWRVNVVPRTVAATSAIDHDQQLRELEARTGIPVTDEIWTPLVY